MGSKPSESHCPQHVGSAPDRDQSGRCRAGSLWQSVADAAAIRVTPDDLAHIIDTECLGGAGAGGGVVEGVEDMIGMTRSPL